MNVNSSIAFKRLLMLIIPLLMLILSACKIELTNEIWMNADDSGKAKIIADVTYPNLSEVLPDTSMTNTNVLDNYIELVNGQETTKILSQNIENKSTEDESRFVYTVEFSFTNLEALNSVLSTTDNPAVNKNKKNITIYPKLFSAVSSDDLEEVLGDESLFDINHHLIFHAPAKIKASKALKHNLADKKTLKWDFVINADWHTNPQAELKFKY